MSNEPDPDRDEVPDPADRLLGRYGRIRSLPGPDPSHSPRALGFPGPTIQEEVGTRIPDAETLCTPRSVYVTVEIPGASRDSIDVAVTENRLTIHAPRPGAHPCHLQVDLPVRVKPESSKATYRNGVLDVTLARAGDSDSTGGTPDGK